MWTPTQLIYHAAMQTPKVVTATGKVVEYSPPNLVDVDDDTCWLCGGKIGGKGQPTKKAIKQTFTDHPYARGQGSRSVCPGCTFCLSHSSLRNYSIVATEKYLLHPSRAEIRDLLLAPPEPPFVMCLAVSGQKWIHFKAAVNYGREVFVVALEETLIMVEPKKLKIILDMVEQLYIYFSKEEITTDRYAQHRIKDIGVDNFNKLENEIANWRGSRIFELAVFVAQKQEEVNKDGKPAPAVAGGKRKDLEPTQVGFDWG